MEDWFNDIAMQIICDGDEATKYKTARIVRSATTIGQCVAEYQRKESVSNG